MQQEQQAHERLVVSIAEAAKMLDISHVTLRSMISKQEIPADKLIRVGGQTKINLRYLRTLAGESEV